MRILNILRGKSLVGIIAISTNLSCLGDCSTNCIWSAPTNGARVGIEISSYHRGNDQPPTCILKIQSVSTNGADNIALRLPKPPEFFNRIELYGPDGQRVGLRRDRQISDFGGVQRAYLRRNEIWQVDYFSLPENFEIKTNGQYQLIVSLKATTNLWWRPPMNVEVGSDGRYKNIYLTTTNIPAYFVFPPVTNTFIILRN